MRFSASIPSGPRLPRLAVGLAVLGGLVIGVTGRADTTPGTVITNQAVVTRKAGGDGGGSVSARSNIDTFAVAPPPVSLPAAGAFSTTENGLVGTTVFGGEFLDKNGRYQPLSTPPPGEVATLPDGSVAVRYGTDCTLHAGDYFLVRFVDHSADLDPVQRDEISITLTSAEGADRETLRLAETGANTGVFTALVVAQPIQPVSGDGRIAMPVSGPLLGDYVTAAGQALHFEAPVLVDPLGLLFDSSTGEPLDGAAVTLVDAATDEPARVYGSDGVSTFPSTITTGRVVHDSGGATYALAPGHYSFPKVVPGRYRLDVKLDAKSGYTVPTSLSNEALAAVPGGPYAIGVGSRGGVFDVVDEVVRLDVPADPSANGLVISLTAAGATTAAAGDFVRFRVAVTNQRGLQALNEVRAVIGLPRGFRLESKTVLLAGKPIEALQSEDGRTFTLRIPQIAGGASVEGAFTVRLAAPAVGRAMTSAVATAQRLRSNEATVSIWVRDELMAQRAQILGRVEKAAGGRGTGEGLAGVAVYLESGWMVVTDSRGFFHFDGVSRGAHVVQVDGTTLPAGAKLVPATNAFEAGGDSGSRVVDVLGGSAWNVEFLVALPLATAAPSAAKPAPSASSRAPGTGVYQKEWIEHESVSQDWMLPAAGDSPALPVVRILVKHFPAHKITATLNEEPVSPLNFDGAATNKAKTMSVSMWSGVNLREGDNTIEIVRKDSWGIERGRETRVIHFSTPPVRAELVPEESKLVADGVTSPVVAVRLIDATGHPARKGVIGSFTVAEPYAARRADGANIRVDVGASPEKPKYTVGADGIARLALEPTMTSGKVRVSLLLAAGPSELSAELLGDRKEWMLLGLAEGSAGYATVNGHVENALTDDLERGGSADGRIAFFAKGRIRGGWLLTAAYDSTKQRDPRAARSLHGKINADAYYTVYGDQSTQMAGAPTLGNLYVKLERKEATALLGDFSLDWSSMAFTSYARELHGAKVDYRGKKVNASAFQSEAGMSSMREEIRGDGTSGPFRLHNGSLMAFGERVVIQQRDRDRADVVVEETELERNVDYVMDYESGTVRLSRPLFSVSPDLQPLFLVVSYELEDANAGKTHGGRVEYKPAPKVSVGATAINESHDGQSATVAGVDTHFALGKYLTLGAEVARSDKATGAANAYKAEVVLRAPKTEARVYASEPGKGFGLGQLNVAEVGNRQVGAEVTARITPKVLVRAQASAQTALSTGETRRSGEVRAEYTDGAWTLRSGVRAVRDEVAGGEVKSALLATAGVSRKALDGRLEISVDREQSLTGPSENADYPERTAVGVSYALTPKVALTAVQEWTDSTQRKTSTTLLGLKSTPWAGGKLIGGVAQRYTDGGGTTVSTGLEQKVRVSPRLELEGGFQTSQVVAGTAAPEVLRTGSAGAGSSTFHSARGFGPAEQTPGDAAYVGVHWKPGAVKYDGRVEYSSTPTSGRRVGALVSAQIEPGRDVGLQASVIASRQLAGADRRPTGVDARLGFAWRPENSGTIVLNRLDVVHGTISTSPGMSGSLGGLGSGTGESGTGTTSADPGAWKVIDNFQLIQRFGDSWQGSLHLGTKRVLTNLDDERYSSWTSLGVLDVRRALGPKWEVGVQGGALIGWGTGTRKTAIGAYVSRRFGDEFTATLGFNAHGFRDDDFSAARYTSPGVYVKFRLRFDHNTVAGLLRFIDED